MNKKPQKIYFAVLATDVVTFRLKDNFLEVLLVSTTSESFKKKKALPGGLVTPKETAEHAAKRYLKEKGNISDVYIEQLYTFSDVDRDPAGRVVSVAYMSLVSYMKSAVEGEGIRWQSVNDLSKLAYDHNKIVSVAVERLRARIGYTTIIKYLLPKKFTLTELQQAYESIVGHELDKRNFRKKIQALKLVIATGQKRVEGAYRPAELYRFTEKDVKIIEIL